MMKFAGHSLFCIGAVSSAALSLLFLGDAASSDIPVRFHVSRAFLFCFLSLLLNNKYVYNTADEFSVLLMSIFRMNNASVNGIRNQVQIRNFGRIYIFPLGVFLEN